MERFATVELGGTKTSCAVGGSPADLSVTTVPTTSPEETLESVVGALGGETFSAIGIASFGPVELRPGHPGYGRIRHTPKASWSDVDVVGPLASAFSVPVGFDTDVNGAALGEASWGAGQGLGSLVYVTVGTGIGGGVLIEGRPVHGLVHPEVGHVVVRRHHDDDYPGSCPFHRDCLEGLAGGPALAGRHGLPAEQLAGAEIERAVEIEAFYLSQMVRDLVYVLAPQRVILGGGVSKLPGLVDKVGALVRVDLAGYPGLSEHDAGFVVPAALGDLAGLAGGLVLAERALTMSDRIG